MILNDIWSNNDESPIYANSLPYQFGRGAESASFQFGADYTLTHIGTSILKGAFDLLEGDVVSPEEAEELYGIKIDKSEPRSHVNFKATHQYLEQEVERARTGNFGKGAWSDLGMTLIGNVLDPAMILPYMAFTKLGVALGKIPSIGKVITALGATKTSRIASRGAFEGGVNVGIGKGAFQYLNEEYGPTEALIDFTAGLLLGGGITALRKVKPAKGTPDILTRDPGEVTELAQKFDLEFAGKAKQLDMFPDDPESLSPLVKRIRDHSAEFGLTDFEYITNREFRETLDIARDIAINDPSKLRVYTRLRQIVDDGETFDPTIVKEIERKQYLTPRPKGEGAFDQGDLISDVVPLIEDKDLSPLVRVSDSDVSTAKADVDGTPIEVEFIPLLEDKRATKFIEDHGSHGYLVATGSLMEESVGSAREKLIRTAKGDTDPALLNVLDEVNNTLKSINELLKLKTVDAPQPLRDLKKAQSVGKKAERVIKKVEDQVKKKRTRAKKQLELELEPDPEKIAKQTEKLQKKIEKAVTKERKAKERKIKKEAKEQEAKVKKEAKEKEKKIKKEMKELEKDQKRIEKLAKDLKKKEEAIKKKGDQNDRKVKKVATKKTKEKVEKTKKKVEKKKGELKKEKEKTKKKLTKEKEKVDKKLAKEKEKTKKKLTKEKEKVDKKLAKEKELDEKHPFRIALDPKPPKKSLSQLIAEANLDVQKVIDYKIQDPEYIDLVDRIKMVKKQTNISPKNKAIMLKRMALKIKDVHLRNKKDGSS